MFTIIAILLIFLCLIGISWFSGTDAPFVPTTNPNLKMALKWVGVKNKIFYELGSGDGRVVIQAAQLGAKAIGIEQSWLRILYSRRQAKKLNLPNASFEHGNIFKKNYLNADVVFIYLLKPAVARLEKKLFSELKQGAIVITQTYHFPNWKPYKKIDTFWLYEKT